MIRICDLMDNFGAETELMLLGFISLMLTVVQGRIVKICVPAHTMDHLLPCSLSLKSSSGGEESNAAPEVSGHQRRLLAEEAAGGFCAAKVILTFFRFVSFGLKCEFIMFWWYISSEILSFYTVVEYLSLLKACTYMVIVSVHLWML